MDPVTGISEDRRAARELGDANADLCFVALCDEDGPSVRTLVLRDVADNTFSLFINRSSPKWETISKDNRAQLLIWYASLQRQYRVTGTLTEIDRAVITDNWHRRPAGSKYMDHTYESLGPQSSVIDSRETLVNFIADLKQSNPEDELHVPDAATGVVLSATQIDRLDLNNPDRIHDRRRYTLKGDDWIEEILIP